MNEPEKKPPQLTEEQKERVLSLLAEEFGIDQADSPEPAVPPPSAGVGEGS